MTEPVNDRVDDDETLLRRIPDLGRADFFPVDLATGEKWLSSGAFTPDDDGISVYREALLSRAGLEARAVVRHPLNAVACLPPSQSVACSSTWSPTRSHSRRPTPIPAWAWLTR